MMLRLAFSLSHLLCGAFCAARSGSRAVECAVLVRIDQLENQLRQLTGIVEQMQYRNQQLEAALKRLQGDAEFRFQEPARGGARPAGPEACRRRPGRSARCGGARPAPAVRAQAAPPASGRRSDAFDPTEHPAAPGVPRALGSIYGNAAPASAISARRSSWRRSRTASPGRRSTSADGERDAAPGQGFARPRGAQAATG